MKCLFGYASNCQNERLETEVSLVVLFSHKNRQVVVWGIDRSPCTYLRLWHSVHLLMLRFRSLTVTVDIYLNSEKKSVESNMFPETLETGAFFARGHGSNATEHIELFPTRGKMFWSINSFLLLYPILFETSFPFSPHNFKHFFFYICWIYHVRDVTVFKWSNVHDRSIDIQTDFLKQWKMLNI